MHIFIDESGTFSSPGTAAVSAVGALVIPDRRLPYLLKHYAALRPSLPQNKGEVKGRLLSEEQVGQVVSLLNNKGAFFEIVTTDMSLNTEEVVDRHKREQAQGITKNLTDEHQPTLVAQSWKLREELEVMAPQLYVQSVLTFELVAIVLRHATLYYAQRMPRELASFRWVIDAKDARQVTPWEEWWSLVVMPMLQSKFLRNPMWHLTEGADYSHFDRKFSTELDEFHKSLKPDSHMGQGTDIKKVMTDSFRFSAEAEPGLELVDIVTNAVRRGMMGNLERAGWKDVPSLMIHRKDHYIRLLTLAMDKTRTAHVVPYAAMLQHFKTGGLSLLA
jgi:hypothetical protein